MDTARGNIRIETAPDGTAIRIGHWQAERRAAGTAILLHGRTEFLEKYNEVVGELTERGYAVWSMDWRGQGLSARPLKNRQKGHIDRFDTYVADLVWFANDVVTPASRPVIVIGHSMGGHIAARALLERRIAPDGMVLTAPMIDLTLSRAASMSTRLLAGIAAKGGGARKYAPGMNDYDPHRVRFDGNVLTADRTRFDAFHAAISNNSDLALGGITFGWLAAAFKSIADLRQLPPPGTTTCPVLMCTAMADRVVSVDAQIGLAARCGWQQLRLPDARHEILMETDVVRDKFWAAFDEFGAAL